MKKRKFGKVINNEKDKIAKWIIKYKSEKKRYKIFFYLMLYTLLFLDLPTFFRFYGEYGFDHKLSRITITGTITVLFICIYILSFLKRVPLKKEKFEYFYWRIERHRLFTIGVGVMALFVTTILLEFRTTIQFFATLMFITFTAFLIVLISVRINPKKLNSIIFTGIGSGCIQLTIITYFVYFFNRWFDLSNLSIVFFLITFMFLIWSIWRISKDKNRLNYIQEIAIRTTPTEKLILAFREDWKKLKDKIEALKIIEKLHKKKKFGVKEALAYELKDSSNKKNNWSKIIIGSILIPLIIHFISSISEGLIQDSFSDIVKEFLRKLGSMF